LLYKRYKIGQIIEGDLLMTKTTLLLLVIPVLCYGQGDYQSTLLRRVEQIRQLDIFDNSVVVYDDSSSYGSTYPIWDPKADYFQDDMVALSRGRMYRALVDSRGKNPVSSSSEWALIGIPRPYLFLRDTAQIDDLKSLLKSDHPYVRIYAFGALVHRQHGDLFEIVVDNLSDTTNVDQMTSDYGYTVRPADLMLWYSVHLFSRSQKDTLRKLILTKYNHLKTLEEVLLFHKPMQDEYPFVKAIVNRNPDFKFGLVALSKYCKSEDLEAISYGFKLDSYSVYYEGYKIFYNAIENCPHSSLKQTLISKKSDEAYATLWIDEYYVRALASYKDRDCLVVLKKLSRLKSRYHLENQAIVYRALKAHYTPIYDSLIKEIKNNMSTKDPWQISPNYLEGSPWNY
jgi:hypothetical protein